MNIPGIIETIPPFFRRHKLVKFLLLISPKSRFSIIKFNGSARLFADLKEPWSRQHLITGNCEPDFFKIAAAFLPEKGVFFDVGANLGFLSFGMMNYLLHHDLEYHLFEANTKAYQLLTRSKTLYPNNKIWINHCCVTNKLGTSKLKVEYSNSPLSFISEEGTQEVENLILDRYIEDHLISKVNFLKMDIEGYEPLALDGMKNSLIKGLVDVIYLELNPQMLYRFGFTTEELFNFLRKANFRIFYVRASDFEFGIADREKAFAVDTYGTPITVSEITSFPGEHQTDILAIHKATPFLCNSIRSNSE